MSLSLRKSCLWHLSNRIFVTTCSKARNVLRKMEIFQIEFTMIIVICLSKTAISEEFKVFRTRPDGEDGWTDGRDSFIIPPSQCTSVHSTHCWRFRADSSSPSQGQCSCSCRYGSATFMFHNSKWECSNNDDVRRVLGK